MDTVLTAHLAIRRRYNILDASHSVILKEKLFLFSLHDVRKLSGVLVKDGYPCKKGCWSTSTVAVNSGSK